MKSPAPNQRGVLLLEVLIALLIFSMGVLGLVGLQASAVQQSGQTKYRTDATLFADELVGSMWVETNRSAANLAAVYGNAANSNTYKAWAARIADALPGAAASPPTVTFVAVPPLPNVVGAASGPADPNLLPTSRVTITIFWQAPSDKQQHNFSLSTEIRP